MLRVSAAITLLYSSMTLLVYGLMSAVGQAARQVAAFLAQHTLLVFIIHMPLLYVLPSFLTVHGFAMGVVRFAICLFLPILVSEILRRAVDTRPWRDALVKAVA